MRDIVEERQRSRRPVAARNPRGWCSEMLRISDSPH